MSRLGFDKIIRRLESLEPAFLKGGIELARKEFQKNFDTESDAESGYAWQNVKRKVPPKILVDTGELRRQAIQTGSLRLYPGKAVLTVDPIDRFGRPYASYHQNGEGKNVQREYITQSNDLTSKQTQLLLTLADKAFL